MNPMQHGNQNQVRDEVSSVLWAALALAYQANPSLTNMGANELPFLLKPLGPGYQQLARIGSWSSNLFSVFIAFILLSLMVAQGDLGDRLAPNFSNSCSHIYHWAQLRNFYHTCSHCLTLNSIFLALWTGLFLHLCSSLPGLLILWNITLCKQHHANTCQKQEH